MKPIYLYHLTQNGVPRYVGVTTNITNRKSKHKRTKPPHTFEIIDTFTDKEQAGIAEQYHIAGYKTYKDGWNKSIGGEMLLTGENHPRYTGFDKQKWSKEYNQTPEVKERDRKRRQTPEYKAKRIEYRKRPEVLEKEREYEKNKRIDTPERKTKKLEYRKRPENIIKKREYDIAYRARKKQLKQ